MQTELTLSNFITIFEQITRALGFWLNDKWQSKNQQ